MSLLIHDGSAQPPSIATYEVQIEAIDHLAQITSDFLMSYLTDYRKVVKYNNQARSTASSEDWRKDQVKFLVSSRERFETAAKAVLPLLRDTCGLGTEQEMFETIDDSTSTSKDLNIQRRRVMAFGCRFFARWENPYTGSLEKMKWSTYRSMDERELQSREFGSDYEREQLLSYRNESPA